MFTVFTVCFADFGQSKGKKQQEAAIPQATSCIPHRKRIRDHVTGI
jgi:hypothetical protein